MVISLSDPGHTHKSVSTEDIYGTVSQPVTSGQQGKSDYASIGSNADPDTATQA